MDTKILIKSNLKFRRKERLKRYLFKKTVLFNFLREDLPRNPDCTGVVITPSKTYIDSRTFYQIKSGLLESMDKSKEKPNNQDMMNHIMMTNEAEYTYDTSMLDDFYSMSISSDVYSSVFPTDIRIMIFDTEVSWYLSFCSVVRDSKHLMRFYPLRSEEKLMKKALKENMMLSFPLGMCSTEEDLELLIARSQDTYNCLDRICSSYYIKKRKFNRIKTTVDIRTDYMTDILGTVDGRMTHSKVDYFNRARHELFFQAVLSMMGEDPPDQSDVDLGEMFGYSGPKFYQTPDYIFHKEGRVVILDFAVTGSDPGSIRDRKIKKYQDLAEGLSMHLGKEVEVEAVVWKINSHCNFFIPPVLDMSEIDIWNSPVIQNLYRLFLDLSSRENYSTFSRNLLEEKEDQEFEDNMEVMTTEMTLLIQSKMNLNPLSVRSADLKWSREDMSFEERLSKDMVLATDTDYYNYLKDNAHNWGDGYLLQVENLLVNMMSNLGPPTNHSRFLEFNLDLVFKEMVKCTQMEEARRKQYVDPGTGIIRKVPKMLPFPVMDMSKGVLKVDSMFDLCFCNIEEVMEDWTFQVDTPSDWFIQKELESEETKSMDYSSGGIGICLDEDFSVVENMISWMMDSTDLVSPEGEFGDMPLNSELLMLYSTNMWKMVCFYSDLVENICYLEGRRFVGVEDKDDDSKRKEGKRGKTIFKKFHNYGIYMKGGSRMTKEKQVRFKIITYREMAFMSGGLDTKTWVTNPDDPTSGTVMSKWLTISSTMIKHYLKIKEVTVSLFLNYVSKLKENKKVDELASFEIDKTFTTWILVLLEHRRGLSTSLQLNRYLMHSATSTITDRLELVKDIFSDPSRSRIESYIKGLQMLWYKKMLDNSESMWEDRVSKLDSTSNDYDRFYTWSPYDLDNKIEFNLMMDCIYICNLFEKDSGFTDHRAKAILSKMSKAEQSFLKERDSDWSKGKVNNLVEFWRSDDKLHQFDEKWIVAATKRFFNKSVSKLEVNLAVEEALSETINSAMMMTSSLVKGPIHSSGLEYSDSTVKTKTFLSLFDQVDKLGTNNLFEMVSKFENCVAIFSLFSKSQVGGPREILIQAVKLRIMVKFFEVMSEKLCKMHPKEMLTKDHQKSVMQSDYMSQNRMEMIDLTRSGIPAVYASFNMDASKWAPGFVMEQFFAFVFSWDIPDNIKNMFLSVISSFSMKVMFTPEALKAKWSKKPKSLLEDREDLEWFRKKSDLQNCMVEILSGMGQGMFHKTSSFLGAVMDDASDLVVESAVMRMTGVRVKSKTLLSSDDKTKFLLFRGKKGGNPSDLKKAIKIYTSCWDSTTRQSNIHINWKKSGLNFIISEFNSLFSIGKRMVWASVKDLYTAHNIPDLSSPEDAVQYMMTSLRRCLEHGVYVDTLENMARCIRGQLRRYYRIDNKLVKKMCMKLDCKEDRLPFHLGFFPVTNLVSKLTMGKEVSIFSSKNSRTLMDFYYKMYSAKYNKSDPKSKGYVPFQEDSRGRFWMSINMRMDKTLTDMKKNFFKDKIRMEMEDIMSSINRNSLNSNLMSNDMKSYQMFSMEYFVGMNRNYEFNDLMPIHSLVRALQYSGKKATIMPRTKRTMDLSSTLDDLCEKKRNLPSWNWEARNALKSDISKVKREMEKDRVDLLEFVDSILLEGDISTSSLDLYDGFKGLEDMEESSKDELTSYPRSRKYYHGSLKKVRMYVKTSGLMVSMEDILKHMMEDSFNSSNKMISTMRNLFSTVLRKSGDKVGAFESLYRNPFHSIYRLMQNSKMPFKDFKDFMILNYKNMRFVEMNMIFDSSCSGNFRDNLKKILMTKSTSSFSYTMPSDKYLKSESNLKFLTNISLGLYTQSLEGVETLPLDLTVMDTKVERAFKIFRATETDMTRLVTTNEINSDRVDYSKMMIRKKNQIHHSWNNFQITAFAVEHERSVDLFIYSRNNLDRSEFDISTFIHILDRFRDEMRAQGKKVTNSTMSDWSTKHSMYYSIMTFHLRTVVYRGPAKWRMVLKLIPMKDSQLGKVGKNSTISMTLLEDQYTVNYDSLMKVKMINSYGDEVTFRDMMMDTPDLEDLDRMLVDKGFLPKFSMPVVDKASESDQYADIQDILKEFNESSEAMGIMGKMSSMFRFSRLKEEEDLDLEDWNEEGLTIQESTVQLPGWTMEKDSKDMVETSEEGGMEDVGSGDGLIQGLKKMMMKLKDKQFSSTENEEYELKDTNEMKEEMVRSRIMTTVGELIQRSLETSVDIDRRLMKSLYDGFRRSGREGDFHNLLLWQINWAFEFSISDSMAVWIYNFLLSRISTFWIVKPTYKVAKFGPEKKDNFPDHLIFISKKKDMSDDLDEIMDMFHL